MLSHLKRVEIELHSFCNRTCQWCPNKDLNRKFHEEMPEDVYLRLLHELKDNNFGINCNSFAAYQQTYITFNRFSEPMSRIDLLKKRVDQAREILGRVLYAVNTNGDFLTPENLNGLHLDNLMIMDYDCIGKEKAIERLKACNVLILGELNGMVYGAHKSITRINYFYDFPKKMLLEDRAGYLTDEINVNKNDEDIALQWRNNRKERDYPCIEPAKYVSIDYAGNVTPCCHIRADYEPHKQYVFGNIKEKSLLEILNCEQWVKFKDLVGSQDYSSYPDACKHCHKER